MFGHHLGLFQVLRSWFTDSDDRALDVVLRDSAGKASMTAAVRPEPCEG
jgi:hypothetical protein